LPSIATYCQPLPAIASLTPNKTGGDILPFMRYSAFICANIRLKPSNLIKLNQGVFHGKNSEFFSGRFYGKSLEKPAKTAKKIAQICAKNMRFLMQKMMRPNSTLISQPWTLNYYALTA